VTRGQIFVQLLNEQATFRRASTGDLDWLTIGSLDSTIAVTFDIVSDVSKHSIKNLTYQYQLD
jgi:hypothetical protein